MVEGETGGEKESRGEEDPREEVFAGRGFSACVFFRCAHRDTDVLLESGGPVSRGGVLQERRAVDICMGSRVSEMPFLLLPFSRASPALFLSPLVSPPSSPSFPPSSPLSPQPFRTASWQRAAGESKRQWKGSGKAKKMPWKGSGKAGERSAKRRFTGRDQTVLVLPEPAELPAAPPVGIENV